MANGIGEGLTFEKVWAMFQETDRQLKETDRVVKELAEQERLAAREREESRRGLEELMRETARNMEETDRRMKLTDKRIGEMSNRFGELAEHLVAPSIKEKFNALGYDFDKTSQNVDIADALDRYRGAEIDILLENGELAIAVEVKAKPHKKDIERHLERMEVLRRWADRHNDGRKFRAALAGAIMSEEVRDAAFAAGFYAIEQTGDTVRIVVPEGFRPREW